MSRARLPLHATTRKGPRTLEVRLIRPRRGIGNEHEIGYPETMARNTILESMLADATVKVVPLGEVLRRFSGKLKKGKKALLAAKRRSSKRKIKRARTQAQPSPVAAPARKRAKPKASAGDARARPGKFGKRVMKPGAARKRSAKFGERIMKRAKPKASPVTAPPPVPAPRRGDVPAHSRGGD